MGDNFLRQQAKNFRKRRDLASDNTGFLSLFEREGVVKQVFDAIPSRDEAYTAGENLLVIPEPGHARVAVVRDHRPVGFVLGEGAQVLIGALTAHDSPGVLPMHVTKVRQLSGVAQLEFGEELRNG